MDKKNKPLKPTTTRYAQTVRLSLIGIVANIALAAAKVLVGVVSGSIAVVLDGINSLTDVFSSVATIIGARIACLRPTRKFPFGYGRVEYITSIAIAAIIIAAGGIALWESIGKILQPTVPDYHAATLIVLLVSVIAKIILWYMYVRTAEKINSQPLRASGIDALYDAILTLGTLASALICIFSGIDLDGWVGAIIALFVLRAGILVLRDAIVSLIGERPDNELVHQIRNLIADHDGVLGVYDLIIDSFGSEFRFVAAHVEVSDCLTASQIHDLCRHISEDLDKDFNAVAILGIYASNSTGKYTDIRNTLEALVEHHPEILQIHGFYVDEKQSTIDFDMVIDFDQDAEEVSRHIVDEMKELYPEYNFNVMADIEYTNLCEEKQVPTD